MLATIHTRLTIRIVGGAEIIVEILGDPGPLPRCLGFRGLELQQDQAGQSAVGMIHIAVWSLLMTTPLAPMSRSRMICLDLRESDRRSQILGVTPEGVALYSRLRRSRSPCRSPPNRVTIADASEGPSPRHKPPRTTAPKGADPFGPRLEGLRSLAEDVELGGHDLLLDVSVGSGFAGFSVLAGEDDLVGLDRAVGRGAEGIDPHGHASSGNRERVGPCFRDRNERRRRRPRWLGRSLRER